MGLIGTYRILHPKAAEYVLFNAHGKFSRIDHMLGHKTSLSKFKKIKIRTLPWQWVKYLGLLHLQCGFDPWPKNIHMPWVQPKKKKETKILSSIFTDHTQWDWKSNVRKKTCKKHKYMEAKQYFTRQPMDCWRNQIKKILGDK